MIGLKVYEMNPVTFSVIGLGSRGLGAYAPYATAHPDQMRIVAVADLVPARRQKAAAQFGLDPGAVFGSAEELLARPRLSDAIIIATQDRTHVTYALKALELGYDILLEKPVSPDKDECLRLLEAAKGSGSTVAVCHVLRYTPFYRTIKELVDRGAIGRLMNIDAVEGVGYFHMAHSFVRGNWRREDLTSPMLLQKSCHDMDILRFIVGHPCESVSSTGTLSFFKEEMAPEGAAGRCLAPCPVKDGCPFDCEKIYLTNESTGALHHPGTWPSDTVSDDTSPQAIRQALEDGPYGCCVFHCDNDVVDHQVCTLNFAGGINATFTMTGFSKENHRTIRLFGTEGELYGDTMDANLHLKRFDSDEELIPIAPTHSGHGGGDEQIMTDFIKALRGQGSLPSTLDASIESHLICFACEESRHSGGALKPVWG